ncbi:MAG: helix-turn-helix domain-containing protein [bacterium]
MKNKRLLSIGEAAKYLGISAMTLRRWDESGKLKALKSPGGWRYYEREMLELFREDLFGVCRAWAGSPVAPNIPNNYYASTQDRFRARLDEMALLISKDSRLSDIESLLPAIVGEIGNNSFDHNLGNWPDVPGIFFAYDVNKRIIVLADRGVGIRETLSRVRLLKDDFSALSVAVTEFVSGRAPENRGNGLKFVMSIAQEYPIGISLQSGIAIAIIEREKELLEISMAESNIRGTLAKIEY